VDLLVLSEVRWGYFRTRKQFLLSRFPERWRVFFAQPPGAGADDPWTPQVEGRVTYFTVPFLKPGTRNALYNRVVATGIGRGLVERAAERHLRATLRRLGVEPRPAVLVSNVYAARALSRLPKKRVFYDFNDSPFQFSASPPWAHEYWRRTRDQVDLFFVVSEHYRRQLSFETDRPLVTLGNGVEWERFALPAPAPADLEGLARPRIGYLGLLSHFLDFDVLEALRTARRDGTLVIAGPGTPATAEGLAALGARDGVRVLPARPYADVPAFMQALDVGVVPFRAADPHVRGINPNKVYQYLAAGIPVITTPILDLAPEPPALQYASDPAAFVRALDAALDARARDAEALAARCRALARPHDWAALAARMVATMEDRLAAA
jgi:glycosyltransferase involved in cell wall biosynthesis